jgi:hypothetical protein
MSCALLLGSREAVSVGFAIGSIRCFFEGIIAWDDLTRCSSTPALRQFACERDQSRWKVQQEARRRYADHYAVLNESPIRESPRHKIKEYKLRRVAPDHAPYMFVLLKPGITFLLENLPDKYGCWIIVNHKNGFTNHHSLLTPVLSFFNGRHQVSQT